MTRIFAIGHVDSGDGPADGVIYPHTVGTNECNIIDLRQTIGTAQQEFVDLLRLQHATKIFWGSHAKRGDSLLDVAQHYVHRLKRAACLLSEHDCQIVRANPGVSQRSLPQFPGSEANCQHYEEQ